MHEDQDVSFFDSIKKKRKIGKAVTVLLKSNKYPTDIELKDALKNIKYQNLDIFDTFESYIRYCVRVKRGKMSSKKNIFILYNCFICRFHSKRI